MKGKKEKKKKRKERKKKRKSASQLKQTGVHSALQLNKNILVVLRKDLLLQRSSLIPCSTSGLVGLLEHLIFWFLVERLHSTATTGSLWPQSTSPTCLWPLTAKHYLWKKEQG